MTNPETLTSEIIVYVLAKIWYIFTEVFTRSNRKIIKKKIEKKETERILSKIAAF